MANHLPLWKNQSVSQEAATLHLDCFPCMKAYHSLELDTPLTYCFDRDRIALCETDRLGRVY